MVLKVETGKEVGGSSEDGRRRSLRLLHPNTVEAGERSWGRKSYVSSASISPEKWCPQRSQSGGLQYLLSALSDEEGFSFNDVFYHHLYSYDNWFRNSEYGEGWTCRALRSRVDMLTCLRADMAMVSAVIGVGIFMAKLQ